MKANYKKSLLGSVLAFVLGTSCCWLTSLAVWLGGATFLTVLSGFVHEYATIILGIALLFFGVGIYQFWKHKKGKGVKFFSIFLLFLLPVSAVFAQQINKNSIIGQWKTDDSRAIIEIFENNGIYYGKIVWLKNTTDNKGNSRKDSKNPDKQKRITSILGATILNNFVFQNNAFINGKIYDPDSGSSYNCKLWLDDNNTLKVRDYCGIFYKTFAWTRVK
jgi:uncharacterized protein (DUF2147 family)